MYTTIEKIVGQNKTPFYIYDLNLLQKTLFYLRKSSIKYNFKVHYALKANFNIPILKMIKKYGLGIDCVSGNEIRMAKKIGFNMQDVVFAGVGKTDDEIIYALENNIFSFNSESIQEIEVINFLAKKSGKIANISLRINPNIDANSHKYLTTGIEENKFGINESDFEKLVLKTQKLKNIKIIGLHFHIGSQITNLNIYKELSTKANKIIDFFHKKGFRIAHINMGGGLGIDYHNPTENSIPDFEKFFDIFAKTIIVKDWQKVHFELGRSIVGQSGNLVTKVLYIKNGGAKKFAVVDAGMTDLIRPALYNSFHKIETLNNNEGSIEYDVVGPVCETSDFLGKKVLLPKTKRGDILIIKSTGAYGQAMNTHYNLRKTTNAFYSYNNKIINYGNQVKNKINNGIMIPSKT